MDFEQQVNEAVRCKRRQEVHGAIRLRISLGICICMSAFLLYSTISSQKKYWHLAIEHKKAISKAEGQIDYFDGRLQETTVKLNDARRELATLTMQNIELTRMAEQARQLELDLEDAFTEAYQAQEKVTLLTARINDIDR